MKGALGEQAKVYDTEMAGVGRIMICYRACLLSLVLRAR